MASSSQLIPLSPFETYMLLDDQPQNPMSIFAELRFETPLDESRLRHALNYATHQNPLLACKLERESTGLFWRYDPNFIPPLTIAKADTNAATFPVSNGQLNHLNLEEYGFEAWYYSDTTTNDLCHSDSDSSPHICRLVLQFHHALVDGIGVRKFLIDFLTSYADPATEQLKSPDLSSLQFREDFSSAVAKQAENPVSTWDRIKNAYYFHFKPPRAIVGPHQESSKELASNEQSPIKTLVFVRELSDQLMDAVKGRQVQLNDLALSLLFLASSEWLKADENVRPRDRIRLMFPYDFRTKEDLRRPAANKLSYAFLGRRIEQCLDPQELHAGIADEIGEIKRTALPLDLLNAFKAISKNPKLMHYAISKSQRMATAVLTYTGDISRGMARQFPQDGNVRIIGDARLSQILAAPPTRPNTNLALGLSINWGQICISASRNRSVLSEKDCEKFLRIYQQKWLDWLGSH